MIGKILPIAVVSILGLALLRSSVTATDAVECAIEIYQFESGSQEKVLLFSDSTQLIKGLSREGFLLAFSVDIVLDDVDSTSCDLTVQAITLGSPIHNYSQQFRVEFGLPAKIEPIVGKNEIEYSLVLTPLRYLDIDTSGCSFVHRDPDQFRFDPSANFNIHYVPQTLADFEWNVSKSLLEETYVQFRDLNRFTLTGKYEVFLCPCDLYSILWDKRFSMMVDPTKSGVFAVYNQQIVSAEPFLLWHISLLRNHGYAPPFISEGYANYLSFGAYDMKKIIRNGGELPIEQLLDTYTYLRADPILADRIGATFARFLIDSYKIDKFLDMYKQADDLNLRETIESTYGKTIAELESDWKIYVDSVSLRARQFRRFGDQAEALHNAPRALELYKETYALATTAADSMRDAGMVARSCLITGDYDGAIRYQRQLVALDTSISLTRMTLAGYKMMTGDYEGAAVDLKIAMVQDTINQFIRFNWALNLLLLGDEEGAAREYENIIAQPGDGSARLESRVLLAELLRQHDNKEDKERSDQLYNYVLSVFATQVGRTRPQPTQQMWLGIAALGVGDTGTAQERLETAMFLETRTFYQGMINLWLGKVSDIRGEHDVATQYYTRVVESPSAAYHIAEAKRLIKSPYK